MNRYKMSRLLVVVFVISVLSLSLLFVTTKNTVNIPVVSDVVNNTVSIVNDLFSRPVRFLSEKKQYFTDLVNAYHENQELKETVAALQGESAKNSSLESENASLRSSLNLQEENSDKQVISGTVSVRTPVSWVDKLVINRGTNDGVSNGMLVTANGGLIGIVEDADSNASSVQLFTTSVEYSKIAVKVSTANGTVYGILSGFDIDNDAFIISQLNSNDDIAIGSQVVTSDLAGDLASNLLIGQVKSVKTSSNNLSRELYVTPAADFSNIYSVIVVGNANE